MEERITLPEIITAVDKMAAEGSDFEKKLSELFYLADMQQLVKLKLDFKEVLFKFL